MHVLGQKLGDANSLVPERKAFMFPIINKRETGVNIRQLMDRRGVTAKNIQQYLGLGCVQSVYRWLDGISMQHKIELQVQ